jgi:hypothetical protein
VENRLAGEVTSPEQSVTSSTRFHWPSRRRGPGSVASSITSNSSAGRSLRSNTVGGRQAGDYIHSLDAAQHYSGKKQRSRHNSREGRRESSRGRDGSRERKAGGSREGSEERGRSSARSWPKPKRSPTSPIPMSPEDLINLSTPKMLGGRAEDPVEPVTARKSSNSRHKASSRTSSRGSRRKSPDARPRPPALDVRGRSQNREGSAIRSPSSPLPMSANVKDYQASDDEQDFLKTVKAQESFRNRHSGSRNTDRSVRDVREPVSPEGSRRDRSESRRRPSKDSPEIGSRPTMQHRTASTEHAGDLKAMKDERQRKKEEAARELEERRKSLAKRPSAPPIPHPNDISPALADHASGIEAADTVMDLPPRSHTADPPRSMYARSGSNIHIGLPATPKAMRLILESDMKSIPSVPPIPATYAAQRSSPQESPKSSPGKEPAGLTLLPSTVYQPPVRPNIPRSMSAPIPDDPADTPNRGVSRGHSIRKARGEIRGIDEMIGGKSERRRGSHDDQLPPPPPPPPLLKELQHLATPPPPPPAPLPHVPHNAGVYASETIEIVMDEEDAAPAPTAVAPVDSTVPVIAPPIPPSGKGHSRGRSITENSISSRISKATERLRSVSRSRKDARTKSPIEVAPYESVPPPVAFNRDVVRSPIVGPGQMTTGLHESELI